MAATLAFQPERATFIIYLLPTVPEHYKPPYLLRVLLLHHPIPFDASETPAQALYSSR